MTYLWKPLAPFSAARVTQTKFWISSTLCNLNHALMRIALHHLVYLLWSMDSKPRVKQGGERVLSDSPNNTPMILGNEGQHSFKIKGCKHWSFKKECWATFCTEPWNDNLSFDDLFCIFLYIHPISTMQILVAMIAQCNNNMLVVAGLQSLHHQGQRMFDSFHPGFWQWHPAWSNQRPQHQGSSMSMYAHFSLPATLQH